jgi:hypothetical protein
MINRIYAASGLIVAIAIFAISANGVNALPATTELPRNMTIDPNGLAFGAGVGISGNFSFVGYGTSLARPQVDIFKRTGPGSWSYLQTIYSPLYPSTSMFGRNCMTSDSNQPDVMIIAESRFESPTAVANIGAAYVLRYQYDLDRWNISETVYSSTTTADSWAGEGLASCAFSGEWLALGARGTYTNAGSILVFRYTPGGASTWTQTTELTCPSSVCDLSIGSSTRITGITSTVSMSGDVLVAGGTDWNSNQGIAFVYQRNATDQWPHTKTLNSPAGQIYKYAYSLATDSRIIAVSIKHSLNGAIYLYKRDLGGTDNWGLLKTVLSGFSDGTDFFGTRIIMSNGHMISTAVLSSVGNRVFAHRQDEGTTDSFTLMGQFAGTSTYPIQETLVAQSSLHLAYIIVGPSLDRHVYIIGACVCAARAGV